MRRYSFTGSFTVDIDAENVAQAFALLRRDRVQCIGSCLGFQRLKNNRDPIRHKVIVSTPVFRLKGGCDADR